MIINESGCITHRNVEFRGERHGMSVWGCTDCEQEFVQYEDLGSGG